MASLPMIRYNPSATAKSGAIKILFDRPLNEWSPQNIGQVNRLVSSSGIEEDLEFFDADMFTIVTEFANPLVINAFHEFWNEHARAGGSFEFWRDRDLVAYIPMSAKSLATSDGVAGTYTITEVTDAAYYLDPSTGLLKTVGTTGSDDNIPRFPAGKYDRAVQIDGSVVNLIDAPSGPFGSGNWTATTMTLSANSTDLKDPAGTNIADKLTATAASANVLYATSTAVGNDVTFGVWLRSQTGDVTGVLQIAGTTGGTENQAITVTPVWQLFTVTADTSSGFTGNLTARIVIDINTEIMYAYGAGLFDDQQFWPGTVGAASSSSITRNLDTLEYSLSDIGQNQGTVMTWFKPRWSPGSHPQLNLFEIGDTQRFLSCLMLASGNIETRMDRNNGSSTGQSTSVAASSFITQDTWHHLAVTYDATQDANLKTYVDGTLRATSAQDAFAPNPTGSKFSIGNSRSDTGQAFADLCEAVVRSDVLTASQIAAVAGRTMPLGIGRNYWSAVKAAETIFQPISLHGTSRATLNFPVKEVLS